MPPISILSIFKVGAKTTCFGSEFDLSYPRDGTSLNASTPPEASHVQYKTFDNVTKIILKVGRGAIVTKADIASAL